VKHSLLFRANNNSKYFNVPPDNPRNVSYLAFAFSEYFGAPGMTCRSQLVFSIVLIFTLISCGGGGGGGDNDNNGGIEPSGDLNPDLKGEFLVDRIYERPVVMDAKSGSYVEIPNTHWTVNDEVFAPTALIYDYYVYPIRNNNNIFLVRARAATDSYLTIQDYDGNYLNQILHLNESIETASISQDLRYIALSRHIHGLSKWFEIYAWDGTLISDRELGEREFHWLMGNRILYTEERTFIFTKKESTEVDYRLTLPETGIQPGNIDTIAVSPNESQIAFTVAEVSNGYGTTLTYSRLYIVNIDGSNIRLVATTYNDQYPRLTRPQWSPDGRWLYIQEGFGTSDIPPELIPIIGNDTNQDMYIVPTEDLGKVFVVSADDEKRSPEVKRFWRSNSTGGVTGKAEVVTNYYWINP
jgi:hypothetical protein